MILHIDANSFYASCERLFRPDLDGKPIAVLSNNDGITISLNQECKNLGFARGDTYAKEEYRYQANHVSIFSSNYTLYADLSLRLNLIYNFYCPEVEYYSIDESFLYFPDWKNMDFTSLGFEIKNAVWKATHIPVAVGIGPTKTLAKICNKLAKTRNGVCNWFQINQEEELKNLKVEKIWGVGRAKSILLYRKGITNAYELKNCSLEFAKKYLTITGYNTVQELNEIPSIEFVTNATRKNITTSRSFARRIETLPELETALAEFTQLAVERMRKEKLACSFISVYIVGGIFLDTEKKYVNVANASFEKPTSFLPDILGTAIKLLHTIYIEGIKYKKVLINLLNLTEDKELQGELFEEESFEKRKKKSSLMETCDFINEKFGRGTLHSGIRNQIKDVDSDGKKADWLMNRNHLSPEYTTNFNQLPISF